MCLKHQASCMKHHVCFNSQHTFAGEYTWVWVQILTATFRYLERGFERRETLGLFVVCWPKPQGLLLFIILSSPQTKEVWPSVFNKWRTRGTERWSNLLEITQHFPGRAGMRARSCVLNHPALVPLGLLGFPCFCGVNWSLRIILCSWLSRGWEEPERIETLFVLSQRQVRWSSQFRAIKGKFVMATSEEVQRFVWGGGCSGREPPHWLEEAQLLFSGGFTLFWRANRHREETSEGALQIHYSN